MILEENWAVAPARVRAFFAGQEDCTQTPEGFSLGGCTVTLTGAEGNLLGKWAIPRSIVRFEGEEDAVKSVYRRFFLTFLSA